MTKENFDEYVFPEETHVDTDTLVDDNIGHITKESRPVKPIPLDVYEEAISTMFGLTPEQREIIFDKISGKDKNKKTVYRYTDKKLNTMYSKLNQKYSKISCIVACEVVGNDTFALFKNLAEDLNLNVNLTKEELVINSAKALMFSSNYTTPPATVYIHDKKYDKIFGTFA